jgi:hypothetical protein
MADLFDKTQLSAKRVASVLERMKVDRKQFVKFYGEVKITRTRKNRMADLTDGQVTAIDGFLKARKAGTATPAMEEALMVTLKIKTATTLARFISDYATRLV